MTYPSRENPSWLLSLLLLLLLLFGCCPAVVSAIKPTECKLYPVYPDGDAQYDLDPGTKTYMTLETILLRNTDNTTRFTTEVRSQGRCLLRINYNDKPSNESTCTIQIDHKERVSLVIQVVDGRLWVYEGGSKEWVVVDGLSISTTIPIPITTTTTTTTKTRKHFVQVAFNCPEGCFQFCDGTLNKTIGRGQNGSLVFYGRPTQQSKAMQQFGNISLLYRDNRKPLEIGSFLHTETDWIMFIVQIKFSIEIINKMVNKTEHCENIYRISDTWLTIGNHRNQIFKSSPPCSWEPRLLLSFTETFNMEWSTCLPPEGSTIQCPSTSPVCASVLNWVLGAALLVLFILEVALYLWYYFVRRQKKVKISDDAQPDSYPATVPDEAEDDPADHIYDYMDMTVFNRVRQKEEERGRRGVSESNSFYNQVFPGREET